MRSVLTTAVLCTVAVCTAALSPALQAAEATTTEDVLNRMDQAAPKFNGMSADLKRMTYTKVLDDKTTESGNMLLRKTGPRDLQMLINITAPDAKTVGFYGAKAEVYYPKMKTVEEWDLGKHRDLVNQFLILGFGTPGRDLAASYSVKYAGEETVDGAKASKLELTPKSAEAKQNISRVDLWIAESGTYPVQQRIVKPSGDYFLFTYDNVKLNPPLTAEELKLKLPKGVKRVSPQK